MRTNNVMEKDNKKKTLTISSNLKKKIDTSAINTDGKKSFAVKKKNLIGQIKMLTDLAQLSLLAKTLVQKRKTLRESLLSNKPLNLL